MNFWRDVAARPSHPRTATPRLLRDAASVGLQIALRFRDLRSERRDTLYLRRFARSSKAPIDLLVLPPGARRDAILARALVLDAGSIEHRLSELDRPLGAFSATSGSRISQKLTRRVARRLAHEAVQSPQSRQTFAEAWFFPLWIELCTISPLRHFARRLAQENQGQLILLPLSRLDFTCLQKWTTSEIEPLLIATEMRRWGASVLLLADGEGIVGEFSGGSGHFSFTAAAHWHAEGAASIPQDATPRIYCGDGIRYSAVVRERIGPAKLLGDPANPGVPSSDILLWGRHESPRRIQVAFARTRASENLSIFSPVGRLPSLGDAFRSLLGPLTQAALARARATVAQSGAREAHVCDHLFFGSSLIAGAIRERGGEVIIWPHSTNAVHAAARERGSVASVTTMTRSAACVWRARLPPSKIYVDSGLTLMRPSTPRPRTADAPIHVIVFAGAHRLLRMPLLPADAHRTAWRDLFRGLNSLPEDFEIYLKPKTTWEPIEWLDLLKEPGCRTQVTSKTAIELDFPNMVFVTVSLGSSALLEGLGRGIPCMIVRAMKVEDYTALDPEWFPIGDADKIIVQLRRCREPAFWDALVRRQLVWYAMETEFKSCFRSDTACV
jgi:hypothetical protein